MKKNSLEKRFCPSKWGNKYTITAGYNVARTEVVKYVSFYIRVSSRFEFLAIFLSYHLPKLFNSATRDCKILKYFFSTENIPIFSKLVFLYLRISVMRTTFSKHFFEYFIF